MKRGAVYVAACVIIGVFAFSGCELLGKMFGKTIRIKGNLLLSPSASSRSVSEGVSRDANFNAAGVDTIVAIPIYDNVLKVWTLEENFANRIEAPIPSGGSFNLSITQEEGVDWVLMLVDSTAATRFDSVVGFVSMSDASESMVLMPVSDANADINLGSLTANGGETSSGQSITQNSSVFNMSVGQLLSLARTDDIYKTIKNIYVNFTDTSHHTVGVRLMYNQSMAALKNMYSTPSAYRLTDYAVSVFTNDFDAGTLDAAKNGSLQFALIPPAPILSIYDATTFYGPDNPLTLSYQGTYLNWDYDGQYGTGRIRNMNYAFNCLTGDVPTGKWVFRVNGAEKAAFDLSVTTPLDSAGNTIIYVPSLKIDTGADDRILGYSLKWMLYDPGTQSYQDVPAADEALLRKMVHDPMVGFLNTGNDALTKYFWRYEDYGFVDTETQYFTDNVAYLDGSDPKSVGTVQVGYVTGGIDVNFWFE